MIKKVKKTKRELNPEKKKENEYKKLIRSILTKCGMQRLSQLEEAPFKFKKLSSDIDDVFIYENIFLLVEYTVSESGKVKEHLSNKIPIFNAIIEDKNGFINYIKSESEVKPEKKEVYDKLKVYNDQSWIVKILYCHLNNMNDGHKDRCKGITYLDYPVVQYFNSLTKSIELSARYELFNFLNIEPEEVGNDGVIKPTEGHELYSGVLLPELYSNFPSGHKIVSFYVDPERLLQTCYVLRRNSWRDNINLYQRMISNKKINAIRSYLKKDKRVFINNIVVTLPHNVMPDKTNNGQGGDQKKPAPVKVQIPLKSNSIGIVDGQHRIFSYHESIKDDDEIKTMRRQQNLLVTGIVFPAGMSLVEQQKFEAQLFLEINSNQTTASRDLKQEINYLLNPFSSDAIATGVLNKLSQNGPLAGKIQQYFYEKDKLKTASIISFGLKPLVSLNGDESLYLIWSDENKDELKESKNAEALERYREFCKDKINDLLMSVVNNLSSEKDRDTKYLWQVGKVKDRKILSTVIINGFLKLLGKLVNKKININQEELMKNFKEIDKFEFSKFVSSHYRQMGEELFQKYFSKE